MKSKKSMIPISYLIFFLLSSCGQSEHDTITGTNSIYEGYKWEQVLPFGNGSFQEEWKPGTFPLGITPVQTHGDSLWMVGQKAAWYSEDGIKWTHYPKKDWGERIYMSYVWFKGRIWMYGGMKYKEREVTNDIWSSADGKNWQESGHAAWPPRKGSAIIVFKNKLWLFGGAADVSKDFESTSFFNDIWSSEDGINWAKETDAASWSPRESSKLVVFKDTLYLFGGNAKGDIWRSANGRNWEQIVQEVEWKQRHDYGAMVFDNRIWVYGGRDTSINHTAAARNDVWYSNDGVKWNRQTEHAPWTVRSCGNSIVYKDKLWIYSGKHTGGQHNWGGDIWTMAKVK